ncbi:MAG: mandelate racemase/muconate lactonizing enzyme family protein [Acidimicrobiales bacterium]
MPEPRIVDLTVATHRVPLPRPWGPDVGHVHLVVVSVEDSDGAQGTGFSWTPRVGALAIHALIAHDVTEAVVGGPVSPEAVWDHLWRHLHEGGGGGITTMAMAAVDIALWDRRGKVLGRTLVDLIGRRHDQVPVYGSGINLHYPLDELEAQTERLVASGVGAVKIKVGRPDLDEDLARVAAVRRILGDRRQLMVDANQRWDLPTARRAARALERFGPDWLEEPLLADDLRAHADLRRSTSLPLALGENLYTAHQFREAVRLGACDIVQPNVVRVGGITPFLRIAEQSRTAGAAVMPHLLVDLSGQLALCLPGRPLVEHVEDASFAALGVLARPNGVRITDGALSAETGPGHGLAFAFDGSERLA